MNVYQLLQSILQPQREEFDQMAYFFLLTYTVIIFSVHRWRDDTMAKRFQLELKNRFDLLQDTADIEEQWSAFKQVLTGSADAAMGTRRGSQKERWIQDRTWNLIDERKMVKCQRDHARTSEVKEATTFRYQVLDRQVKGSCRKDKKAWMEERGVEASQAADKNDTKTLYRIVRELTGARSNANVPIKDKNGKTLLTKEEQDARWIEHFKETLNQPPPTVTHVFKG